MLSREAISDDWWMKEPFSRNRRLELVEVELATFFVRSARVREEGLEEEKGNTLPSCLAKTDG